MSREYAMSRVKDALEQSDGNHMKAARLITEWLQSDNSLYFGLTAPHMKSIIAHAIAHIDQSSASGSVQPEPHHAITKDEEVGELGEAILAGLTGKTGSFGEGNPEGIPKPGKASQQHIDALTAMSAAYKNKRQE